MKTIRTEVLEIAFEEGGPGDGAPVLLLHGWPDSPRGWNAVSARLQAQGFRTIAPYLRGSGPTRFLSGETPRVGVGVALAQDAIDLADRLGLQRFAVVGHDWGARAAYAMATLVPARVMAVGAIALAYQPGGRFQVPSFEQARRFWYQWFFCVDGAAAKFRDDPVGFARLQWDSWSPLGWYDDAEFSRTAESFSNPDWVAVTLHAYRARWRTGEARDQRYDDLQKLLASSESVATPVLMIQGGADFCDAPTESEGLESHFTAGYERLLLEGVGHFPHREAPEAVAAALLRHLANAAL